MSDLLLDVEKPALRRDLPDFSPGDSVRVHVKVREGEKERIQVFAGVVIARRGGGVRETFAVRKISSGIGVERIFPLHSPVIDRIDVDRKRRRAAREAVLPQRAQGQGREDRREARGVARLRSPPCGVILSPRSSRSWGASPSSIASTASCAAADMFCVAGVDEAGRGSLAGPVVAAAVILPLGCVLPGLDDSKRLDAESRARIDREIRRCALAFAIGVVSAADIDARDILSASLAAMRVAIDALRPEPEALLLDAVTVPGVRRPQLPIIHGDALCSSIAAASVVAKVHRDGLLDELGRCYPAYGFEHHKGYGTPEHWDALQRYGPCPEHRLTYHGVVPGDEPPPPPTPRGRRVSPKGRRNPVRI